MLLIETTETEEVKRTVTKKRELIVTPIGATLLLTMLLIFDNRSLTVIVNLATAIAELRF